MGSEPCEYIGSYAAEPSNSVSEAFQEFIRSHAFILPSTCGEHVPPGASVATWMAQNGATHRLDYVGVDARCHRHYMMAYTDHAIDLARVKVYHFAARVDLKYTPRPPQRCSQSNPAAA